MKTIDKYDISVYNQLLSVPHKLEELLLEFINMSPQRRIQRMKYIKLIQEIKVTRKTGKLYYRITKYKSQLLLLRVRLYINSENE